MVNNYKSVNKSLLSICGKELTLLFLCPIAEATAVVPVKDTKRIINRSNMKKHLILITIKPEFGQNIKYEKFDIFFYSFRYKSYLFFFPPERLYL